MKSLSPNIVIIAGPNGAGKSTLAPLLLRDAFGLLEYVNADTIAAGLSAFSPETVAFEAGRIMLERLRNLAEAGESFAFETTLATRSYASWLRGLKANGYQVHLAYLWLHTPELAIERVKERVRQGGHDVPEETIRRRYERGLRNLLVLYRGLVDTWAIYDNSMVERPSLVAMGGEGGSVTIVDLALWERITEVVA